jgi:hypothetical protein
MRPIVRTRTSNSPAFLGGIAASAAVQAQAEARLSQQAAEILSTSGADLAALSPEARLSLEASLQAAPPTAKEASAPAAARGDAPQEEDLSEKAKKEIETKTEGPKGLEEVKPKWLTKDVATAAKDAPPEVQSLFKEVQDLMSKTEANEVALKKFKEGLGQTATDESLRQKSQLLFDAISKQEMKVLRVGTNLLSADVSNTLLSAKLSKAEVKAIADFKAVIEKHKKGQTEAAKKIAEMTQKAFARSGGSQKQSQRVAFFEGIAKLQAEAKTDEEKAVVLSIVAGLADLLSKAADWFKGLFNDLPDLDEATNTLLQAFSAPAVAARLRAELVPGRSPEDAQVYEGLDEEAANLASRVAEMVNESGDNLKRKAPDVYGHFPYIKQGLLEALIKNLEGRV